MSDRLDGSLHPEDCTEAATQNEVLPELEDDPETAVVDSQGESQLDIETNNDVESNDEGKIIYIILYVIITMPYKDQTRDRVKEPS